MKPTTLDFLRYSSLAPFTTPDAVPFTYTVDGVVYHGIPAEFSPKTTQRRIDASIVETTVTATMPSGLSLTAACKEYRDFPVTEWVMYMENTATENSPVICDWRFDTTFASHAAWLEYGNGDTCRDNGYEWYLTPVTAPITVEPSGDGTSCNGAFPYMRLRFHGWGVNIAVGWTGTWSVHTEPSEGRLSFSVKQQRFAAYLKPGETVRTPSVTMQAYHGDEDRARNLWRSFYFAHVLPREKDGRPLSPKLVLHTFKIGGVPEFCGVTEENQLLGIDTYISRGLKPDIWWIDAGWYPCNNVWQDIGNWVPDPARLPNGLAPIGKKCEEEDIDLLLWFEPERIRRTSAFYHEHADKLLFRRLPDGTKDEKNGINALLNLGDKSVCDFTIDWVDRLIKESHIRVYRQDFNFSPAPYWRENEEENRVGILENLHIQGYYRFWDELLLRNPGLWIDSCASGGRRNDIETMRRSVPLHYTDVGYGNHLIKQKQHRQMFEWIPYFRAHTMNWDEADGSYSGKNHPVDEFSYQNALTPSVTSMIEWNDPDHLYALGRRFHPVWRRAAEMMLKYDYYPLTACRKDASDFYAMQFDGDDEGFLQIIRNVKVEHDTIVLQLKIDPSRTYTFEDPLGKRTLEARGSDLLKDGFSDRLAPRSGVIWFYKKK